LQLWEETDKSVAFPATAANDSGPEVRNDTETMKPTQGDKAGRRLT
jgi:hypothetical protein